MNDTKQYGFYGEPMWIQTDTNSWTANLLTGDSNVTTNNTADIKVLIERLNALLTTIEELKKDNEYLKEMMNEEFRRTNE
jgi:ribonuclease HI